jgi:hypothetical protein
LQRIDDAAKFEEHWKITFTNIQKTASARGVMAPPYQRIEPQDMRIDVITPTAAVVTFHLSPAPRPRRWLFPSATDVHVHPDERALED